ncbi:MAG: acyl carrier protein [Mycoplasmataceae bacterium]|jgi:acyl carrier protein|nr:acyl carrier protein [Mycoplasmataceae bacterium]
MLEQIKAIYKKVMGSKAVADSKINANSRLFDDLMMTSVTILMMAITIQNQFKIKLPNLDTMKTLTVQDIINVIESLTKNEK